MALPAAGAVGDVAHRIDRLMRRAAGDQRVPPGQRPRPAPAAPRSPPGSPAVRPAGRGRIRCRPSRPRPAPRRGCRATRSSAMLACVAACSHMRTFIAGATSTGLSVASSTVEARSSARPAAIFARMFGGGRRDHHKIGAARELDVPHLAFVGQREQVGVDLALAQRLQRQRRDELRARVGQHAGHAAASAAQQADQFQRLVGGDAAGDDQQDALAGQVAHQTSPRLAGGEPSTLPPETCPSQPPPRMDRGDAADRLRTARAQSRLPQHRGQRLLIGERADALGQIAIARRRPARRMRPSRGSTRNDHASYSGRSAATCNGENSRQKNRPPGFSTRRASRQHRGLVGAVAQAERDRHAIHARSGSGRRSASATSSDAPPTKPRAQRAVARHLAASTR